MGLEDFKYIVCDNNKRPLHSFDVTHTYEEVKDKPNLAIKLEEPYLILDIDNEDEFEIMCQMIRDLDIKTRILKTSRGGHFWFKSLKPLKNSVHSCTPVTLHVDVKSWGKQCMEVVKVNNEWRKWLKYDENVDMLPFFFKPIKYDKNILHFKNGDGRDDALFTFIIPLINERLSKSEIRQCFNLINKYIFDEPLSEAELDKMFDGNKVFDSISSIFYNRNKFQHHVFADYIISEFNIKGYGGDVYFYNETYYTNDKDILFNKMLATIPELTSNQLREVYENIRVKMSVKHEPLNSDYVNLQNGLYNIMTDEFIPHTPDIFTVHQLNCAYNPQAFSQEVYDVIKSLACGNEDIITLLIQMLGYCLLSDCRFQKSFILLGNGRNGKSMFLEMIRNWLGDDNCSSLALEDLSEKFRTAELVGKMVNIGDDSGHNLLQNTAIFKKLVTGDSITVERKNQHPFKYKNTAKMIFAANSLPPTTDKSDGFFRRCIVIPFNAVFRETDKNYDENKLDKLITDDAKSYLFKVALLGLSSIMKEKKFTIPQSSEYLNEEYEANNNNVKMWESSIEDMNKFKSTHEAYTAYLMYCTYNRYKPVSAGKFNQEMVRIQRKTKE